MVNFVVELIQSIFLIVAAIILIIVALGILRLDDDMDKVIYARIHMLGMADIALVLAMIGLGQFLLAAVYFVLAPFVVHAMANAYYYGEDERKYETSDEITGRIDDNVHNKLTLDKNTTIDDKFKFNFESNLESDIVSYTKTEESKGIISDKLGVVIKEVSTEKSKSIVSDKLDVVIKEVSTDDIENSSLNKDKEEKHD